MVSILGEQRKSRDISIFSRNKFVLGPSLEKKSGVITKMFVGKSTLFWNLMHFHYLIVDDNNK